MLLPFESVMLDSCPSVRNRSTVPLASVSTKAPSTWVNTDRVAGLRRIDVAKITRLYRGAAVYKRREDHWVKDLGPGRRGDVNVARSVGRGRHTERIGPAVAKRARIVPVQKARAVDAG